jgi:hypothetical protein
MLSTIFMAPVDAPKKGKPIGVTIKDKPIRIEMLCCITKRFCASSRARRLCRCNRAGEHLEEAFPRFVLPFTRPRGLANHVEF